MKNVSLLWVVAWFVLFGCKPRPEPTKPELIVLPDSLPELCEVTRIPAHERPRRVDTLHDSDGMDAFFASLPLSDSIGSNTAMLQGLGGLDVALLPQMPLIEALLWRRCGWKVESDGLIGSLKIDTHYDVHAIRVQKPGSDCSPTAICEPCEAYMKFALSGKPICMACYGCPGLPAQPAKKP
jgi:hypothetical protein